MKKLLSMVLALSALLFTTALQAQDYSEDYGGCGDCCDSTEGFYFGGLAGVVMFNDIIGHDSRTAGTIFEVEQDAGFAIGGFMGYRFCNGLRIEGEIAYRSADPDEVTVYDGTPAAESLTSKDLSVISYMANIMYECAFIVCDCCLRPYFGAGFGAATVNFEANSANMTAVDGDDTVFAYQLIVGLAYPVNECIDVALEYRYFDTSEFEFSPAASETFESREYIGSHNLLVTAKYVFGSLW